MPKANDEFMAIHAAAERYNVDIYTIYNWVESGKVRKIPHPTRKGWYLYSDADVAQCAADLNAKEVVEFDDEEGHWIWVRYETEVAKKIRNYISKYKDGMPALGGRKPRIKERKFRRRPRDYIHADDLSTIKKFPSTAPVVDWDRWMTRDMIHKEFGFGQGFYDTWEERPHPAIDKPLTVKYETFPSKHTRHSRPIYLRSEIEVIYMFRNTAIKEIGQWITDERVMELFDFSHAVLTGWREVGCVYIGGKPIKFKRLSGRRRGGNLLEKRYYYFRPQLQQIHDQIQKAVAVKDGVPLNGKFYWMAPEASKIAGISEVRLHESKTKKSSYFDPPRTIEFERMPLYAGGRSSPWNFIFLDADLREIRAVKDGRPRPSRSNGHDGGKLDAIHRDLHARHDTADAKIDDGAKKNDAHHAGAKARDEAAAAHAKAHEDAEAGRHRKTQRVAAIAYRRTSGQLEMFKDNAAPALPPDRLMPDEHQEAVLRELARQNRAMKMVELDAAGAASRRTLTTLMPALEKAGYVAKQNGPRGGWVIAELGRAALQAIPPNSAAH